MSNEKTKSGSGQAGNPGASGAPGAAGAGDGGRGGAGGAGGTGATGAKGSTGEKGTTGAKGSTGARGAIGQTGFTGKKGATGAKGGKLGHEVALSFGALALVSFAVLGVMAQAIIGSNKAIDRLEKLERAQAEFRVERAKQTAVTDKRICMEIEKLKQEFLGSPRYTPVNCNKLPSAKPPLVP